MKTRIIQSEPDDRDRRAEPGRGGTRPPRGVAARMARWSARHWKTATFGWLLIVVVLFAASLQIGTESIDYETSGPGESGRADRILDAEFTQPAGESVLFESQNLTVADPGFRAAIDQAVVELGSNPDLVAIRSPLSPPNQGQVSEDGRAAYVAFEYRGDPDDAAGKLDAVAAQVAGVQAANPELYVGLIGDESADDAIDGAIGDDLAKAGMLSVPITLIILIVALAALVAASIPLLIGLTAVLGTLGLVAIVSQALPVDQYVSAVVLLVGLAVGVDYAMFYLKRARQERANGRAEGAAVEAAAATAGRSVLISGLTVMLAMAGMFFTGDQGFASFGLATMMVAGVAMIASLTVLPALLSRLGDRVDAGRIPFLGRIRDDRGEGRFWGAIVTRVLRRPVLSALVSGGLLIALAVPALQLHTAVGGVEALPDSIPVIDTYDRMQAAFPGTEIPAVVVVQASDVTDPQVQEQIARLGDEALAAGHAREPIGVSVNDDRTVARIEIPIAGTGNDDASNAALDALRDEIVPATVGTLPGVEADITGQTAQSRDFGDQMRSALPLVFGFVLALAFLLMLVAFRSIVIAVKAIVLNLLSVAAAYGVLVLVFQHGWFKGLLGFESTAGIDPIIPILLFVILFGLSMDYHVFIISKIRELRDRGAGTDEAITRGITSTAGVVTSAAAVMVGVFAVFATLQFLFFKQFGVGLAVAILLDATIIRAVLLPATMKLLGEWNWYLPRWLEWLPGAPVRRRGGITEPVPAPGASPTGV
jgi:RND superfamily putative drug exporter